ncbi:MAG: phosphopentomutase [Oscillospiraceae bacterium]|nr:phosphopentomutase [Oscillospiraceae bacterium]
MKRVFLFVLDSLGIGAMPDAERFGDSSDCNTLKRISKSRHFSVKNLCALGLGNIEGVEYLQSCPDAPAAAFRMAEASNGKDTTLGHWEIAGIISENPMPTYPDGFPEEIIKAFSEAAGRKVLCNKPYSGTEVIKDFGREHIESGDLIVYTSADSVFQIAAHEDVVPIEKLYEYCRAARGLLKGEHAVGRVIARPFVGQYPDFERTANRRDFSLTPPKDTLLDAVKAAGKEVIAIGKISDIFAGKGVTTSIHTHSNDEGMQETLKAAKTDFEGLCFVNLVDFDSKYGHRQDIDGYAKALSDFDRWLPLFLKCLREGDLIMITADHGCDPGDSSTDHTREYTPLLMLGKGIEGGCRGERKTFADIGASAAKWLSVPFKGAGESLI